MTKGRSISQQRIARDLGVSQALVSLVLNGKRENISDESYERIWKYAVKRGYRPKGMQANGNATANTVGFVLRAGLRLYTQSNFFSHIQHGLHTALQGRGFNSVFLGAEDTLNRQSLKEELPRSNLFGLVIMGQVDEAFVRSIKAVQRNVVAVSAAYPGLCHSVMPNERQALDLLVEHLVELGHREVAWLGGNKQFRQNLTRRAALVDALRQRGLDLADAFAVDVLSGDRLDGRRAAQLLLERASPERLPTAWVCLNGLMARGVINYLTQQGLQVPGQISVVAVDATRVCVEEHPQITGANADPEKMGAKAAELLLQAATQTDEALLDVILPAQLTVRETSAPAGSRTRPGSMAVASKPARIRAHP
jgi:LacI family transcriptional regulator, galactose operon repressor